MPNGTSRHRYSQRVSGKIAVKVINHFYGDEVLRVFGV
jgi:hypothetical protein